MASVQAILDPDSDNPPVLEGIKGNQEFLSRFSDFIHGDNDAQVILEFLKSHIYAHFEDFWEVSPAIGIEEYQSELGEVYDHLEQDITASVLLVPGTIRGDWLTELKHELDVTFQDYREGEPFQEYLEWLSEKYREENASEAGDDIYLEETGQPSSNPRHSQVRVTKVKGRLTTEEEYNVNESHEKHRQREKRIRYKHIWNHLTISRDETSASDFVRAFLHTIFSSKIHTTENQDDRFAQAPAPEPLVQHDYNTTKAQDPIREEIRRRQERSSKHMQRVLNDQKLRLYLAHQNMMSGTTPKHIHTSHEISLGTLAPDMVASKRDQEAELIGEENMSSGQYESNSIDDEAAVNGPGLSSTADEQLDLIHRIASLERENKRLKATQLVCTRHQVLYFLPEATAVRPPGTINMHPPVRMAYLDEPTWSIGPTGEIMLRAHSPITDVNGYLRQRPEM